MQAVSNMPVAVAAKEEPEIDLEVHTSDIAKPVGPHSYNTEEDLVIMTSLRHTGHSRAAARHESHGAEVLPEFVSAPFRKISELHDELQGIVDSLDSKIDAVIEREEKEFLTAYKAHLMKIQDELNLYRNRINGKELELKRNSLLVSLQQSLDFFKKETLRLASVVDSQKAEIEKRDAEIELLKKDRQFLESQVKKAKRENKAIQLVMQKSTEAGERAMTSPFSGVPTEQDLGTAAMLRPETDARVNYQSKFDAFVRCLRFLNCGRDQVLDHCQKYYQEMALRHEELTANLHLQLEHERKISQKLRAAQVESAGSRAELEQIFYECVEEARKDVINRRMNQTKQANLTQTSFLGKERDGLHSTDKVKVMEKFMRNDKLLRALYETVFSHKAANGSLPDLAGKESALSPIRRVPLENARMSETTGVFPMGKGQGRGRSSTRRPRPRSPKYCVRNGKLMIMSRKGRESDDKQNRSHL